MKNKNKKRMVGLSVTVILIILIFAFLVPPATSVKLSPGSIGSYKADFSVYKGRDIKFENVYVNITGPEKIPIKFINFSIFDDELLIDFVTFYVDGEEKSDSQDCFEIEIVDIIGLASYSYGYGYAYDEEAETGHYFGYDFGYGYGGEELTNVIFIYNITYTTTTKGTDLHAELNLNIASYPLEPSISSQLFDVKTKSSSSGGGSISGGNNAPIADAGIPESGTEGEPIIFDGTESYDPDEDPITYLWDFGDGSTGTGPKPEHTYDNPGTYEVTLTVSDGSKTDIDTITVTIEEDEDSDDDGYTDDMEKSYGTNETDPEDKPMDTDGDGTPDEDSQDGKYQGDTDDDNDGVPDKKEEEIGSDPKDSTDIETITIGNNKYYLIDSDDDGEIDTIYNPQTDETATIEKIGNEILIDTDGDGKSDYAYNTATGQTNEYTEKKKEEELPFMLITGIIAAIIVILLVIVYLFKTGYLYIEKKK